MPVTENQILKKRYKIENLFARIKQFNRVHVRRDKLIGGRKSHTFSTSNSEEQSKIKFYFLLPYCNLFRICPFSIYENNLN